MSQIRKSAKQLDSEVKAIRKELWGGLLPWQIIDKNKLTQKEYDKYLTILTRQAGKRFNKLDADFLALQSELYIERLTSIAVSCSLLRAKACVSDEKNEIDIEPDYMRLEAEVWKLIMEHHAEMVKAVTAFKTYESMKKQATAAENEGKEGISLGKDNPNSHMGVT